MNPATRPLQDLLSEFRATWPVQQVTYGGTTWRYRAGGAGTEPLLWLTGALGVGEFAFAYAHALASAFRIYMPDYPPLRTLDGAVDGLAALLDAERVSAASVVGGSFGGMLAQQLVRRHPDRVRALILSHTSPPQPSWARTALIRIVTRLLPERQYRALFRRRLRVAFAAGDPFWLHYFDSTVAGLTKRDLASKLLLTSQFLQLRYSPTDLEHWAGRVLILEADDDPLMPAHVRDALRALYPQAQVHTFSGTGHSAAVLHPEAYAEVISRFLLRRAAS